VVKYNHDIKLQNNKNMGLFDKLRNIVKVLKEAYKIKEYEKIVDAQQKITEMRQKIFDLEKENKELCDKLEIKGKVVPGDNVYWLEEGANKDGPFCTCCYDSEKKLIRLHKMSHVKVWTCHICKTNVDQENLNKFGPKERFNKER
jgi:hypothetical protein